MDHIPTHVAVIPDGNRRWAEANGIPALEGHKAGYENLKKTASLAFDRGVKYLTAYGFSTENWSRSKDEVSYLMKLMAWVLREEVKGYHEQGIRIRIAGSREGLSDEMVDLIDAAETLTENNTNGTLITCFNYGGRRDLIEAVQGLIAAETPAEDITEEAIRGSLSTASIPDPDLIIRTSGERRLSNYLIWESAYSELYFTDTLWPDFDEAELEKALADFAKRKRNFGK